MPETFISRMERDISTSFFRIGKKRKPTLEYHAKHFKMDPITKETAVATVVALAGAGGGGTLFYQTAKLLLPHLTNLSPKYKSVFLILVLLMGFVLTLVSIKGLDQGQSDEEGGKQTGLIENAGFQIISTVHAHFVKASQDVCGVETGSQYLWLTFVASQPYYRSHSEDGNFTITLRSLNLDEGTANFSVGTGRDTKINFDLKIDGQRKVSFNGCQYMLHYKGYRSYNAGIQYLFRTRYVVDYELVRDDSP